VDEWPNDGALAEAKRRIETARLTRVSELDLSGLQLTVVPPELGQLVNLTELYLHQKALLHKWKLGQKSHRNPLF
jgi:hypothetical protein